MSKQKLTDKVVNDIFRKCLEKVLNDYYSKERGTIPLEMSFEEYAQTVSKRVFHGQVISTVLERYRKSECTYTFEEYIIRLIEESKKYKKKEDKR